MRDAEILAIEPTYIKFAWQDKEYTMSPFGKTSSKELEKDKTEKKDAEDKKDKTDTQNKSTEESARPRRWGEGRRRPRPEGERRRRLRPDGEWTGRRGRMRAEREEATATD